MQFISNCTFLATVLLGKRKSALFFKENSLSFSNHVHFYNKKEGKTEPYRQRSLIIRNYLAELIDADRIRFICDL